MPEGHTIFRLAADHNRSLARQVLHITSPQGRFTHDADQLDGRRLTRVYSAGKHLFYRFADRGNALSILHVHLGLFGRFRTHTNPPPEPRGAVRVRFQGKRQTVDLSGPNRCELIDEAGKKRILARLGPDPLQPHADASSAWDRIHKSRTPIGLLLMDQSVVAGIGNIYRTELLHLTGIHPRTPGVAITKPQFNRLWKLAVKFMKIGVKFNRIITIDLKKLKGDPTKRPRRQLFRIFKKAACPDCGELIEKFTQAGRKVFACPRCQPEVEMPTSTPKRPSHAAQRQQGAFK